MCLDECRAFKLLHGRTPPQRGLFPKPHLNHGVLAHSVSYLAPQAQPSLLHVLDSFGIHQDVSQVIAQLCRVWLCYPRPWHPSGRGTCQLEVPFSCSATNTSCTSTSPVVESPQVLRLDIAKDKSSPLPPGRSVLAKVDQLLMNSRPSHDFFELFRPPHLRAPRVFKAPRNSKAVQGPDQLQCSPQCLVASLHLDLLIFWQVIKPPRL